MALVIIANEKKIVSFFVCNQESREDLILKISNTCIMSTSE